jgi:hypothetical protein
LVSAECVLPLAWCLWTSTWLIASAATSQAPVRCQNYWSFSASDPPGCLAVAALSGVPVAEKSVRDQDYMYSILHEGAAIKWGAGRTPHRTQPQAFLLKWRTIALGPLASGARRPHATLNDACWPVMTQEERARSDLGWARSRSDVGRRIERRRETNPTASRKFLVIKGKPAMGTKRTPMSEDEGNWTA